VFAPWWAILISLSHLVMILFMRWQGAVDALFRWSLVSSSTLSGAVTANTAADAPANSSTNSAVGFARGRTRPRGAILGVGREWHGHASKSGKCQYSVAHVEDFLHWFGFGEDRYGRDDAPPWMHAYAGEAATMTTTWTGYFLAGENSNHLRTRLRWRAKQPTRGWSWRMTVLTGHGHRDAHGAHCGITDHTFATTGKGESVAANEPSPRPVDDTILSGAVGGALDGRCTISKL
jgi:hypothetical protein